MKIWVDSDEWYPVYTADNGEKSARYNLKPWGKEVEVSDEFWTKCQRVFKEFDEVQAELEKLATGK